MTEKTYIDKRIAKGGKNLSGALIDLSANGSEFIVRGMSEEYFDDTDIQRKIHDIKMDRIYFRTN